MGSSGGDSSDDNNPFNKVAHSISNAVINMTTGGLVGMQDGKLGEGYASHAVDEGIGEISGRNVARKQMMNESDAVTAEQVQRIKDLQNQQLQNQQNDVTSSNAAAASIKAQNRNNGIPDSMTNSQMSLTKDFLGL